MLISARTISSQTPKVQSRGSRTEDAINPDARRIYDRPEESRRQGNPWRRPRLAEVRARDAEERASETAAALSYRAAAVRSDTVRPDSVTGAPFAALAKTAEFWDLLGAVSPSVSIHKNTDERTKTSKATKPSLDDLFARVIDID